MAELEHLPILEWGWGDAVQFLLTNKAWFLVGHLAGGAITNTTQLLGSKEQAKLEACSKSLHSLVEEPALENGTSDAHLGQRAQTMHGCACHAWPGWGWNC